VTLQQRLFASNYAVRQAVVALPNRWPAVSTTEGFKDWNQFLHVATSMAASTVWLLSRVRGQELASERKRVRENAKEMHLRLLN